MPEPPQLQAIREAIAARPADWRTASADLNDPGEHTLKALRSQLVDELGAAPSPRTESVYLELLRATG